MYVVIEDSACSNHTESTTKQWRKSAPPILSTSHCEFNGARLCIHAQKTIPLAPIHSFTKQIFIVSTIVYPNFMDIIFIDSLYVPYKRLPSINNIFTRVSSFLYFIFIAHFYVHLHEPQKFFSCCAFTCFFLNGFQPNLYQHFSHVCSTCQPFSV